MCSEEFIEIFKIMLILILILLLMLLLILMLMLILAVAIVLLWGRKKRKKSGAEGKLSSGRNGQTIATESISSEKQKGISTHPNEKYSFRLG